MTELEIGGGRISEAAQSLPNTMSDEEREASEREAERREMAFRELFAGDPKVVLMSLLHRVTALEDAIASLGGLESKLAEAQDKLDSRPETVMPDFEPKPDEPPSGIADLFQADKPLAPQARVLRDLWLQIGHQIQRGEATADEIRKHERLSSELEFINRHAFDGV